jgi:molybdenum cofactor cytidylyltransferase
MVSAIITAAGKNRRMLKDLKARNLKIKNKLLLDLQGKPIIQRTIEKVLNTGINECIVVIGHFSDEILPVLDTIDDKRLKIVKNSELNIKLSESLLNGIKNINPDYCLCVAADQPSISTKTLKKLINKAIEAKNLDNTITILAREKTGYINSAKGLGMPFVCHSNLLKKYLKRKKSNLNPIIKDMIDDGILFYAIPPHKSSELLNINVYADYLKVLKNFH